jgi:indolepyruvate ferredoxin oxidoreductase beta subunit
MEVKRTRPVTILIAALGGEGGGVLADWLIDAAKQHDFPVQSTSVPGVAQRTGATTYYIEIFPVPSSSLAGARPVMALTPTPGDVDVAVASELVEAGRLIQNGFVNPQRTTLIASSHREYAVIEKMAMADGRYDGEKVVTAARSLAQRLILADLRALALQQGTIINTVMFGAMVGAGTLPVSRAACEQAIRNAGKSVDASLKGFAAGYALATERPADFRSPASGMGEGSPGSAMPSRIQALPEAIRGVIVEGAGQVADYQDCAYAEQYLDRVERLLQMEKDAGGGPVGYRVTRDTARYLALWMCYEDVIRVADLKTRHERLIAVRSEVGAGADEPIRLTEYMKPGLDELCSVLPTALADWTRKRFASRKQSLHLGLHIRTDTVSGFVLLSLLRSLRIVRRRTSRYTVEQTLIERWLDAVRLSLSHSLYLAHELALCGNLVKGYGETSERGHGNLKLILADVERDAAADNLSQRVKRAREAALTDPEGRSLAVSLGLPPPQLVAKPIRFVRPDSSKSRYEKAL